MPKMDGITFCNKIKNNISVSHVPVLLLTAKSGKENVLTGFESGADDYVEKPFDTDILLARIQALLENRERIWTQLQKKHVGKISSKKLNSKGKSEKIFPHCFFIKSRVFAVSSGLNLTEITSI